MAYKYYKSDFALLITRKSQYTDDQGNSVAITNEVPFVFRLYSPLLGNSADSYIASFENGIFKNCAFVGENQILVFVDLSQHNFNVGELMLEAEWMIADTHYEGDQLNNIVRLFNTGVFLTDEPDLDSEGVMQFIIDDGVDSQLVISFIDNAVSKRINYLLNAINNLPDAQSVTLQVSSHEMHIIALRRELEQAKTQLNTNSALVNSANEEIHKLMNAKLKVVQTENLSDIL